MSHIAQRTTILDSCGKTLGEIRITRAVAGVCYAEALADNGTCHTFMRFTKNKSRWANNKIPCLATNKQRIDAAVSYVFYDKSILHFLAERSVYDMHCIG